MVYGEFCNLRQMQFAIRLLLIMIIPLMPIFTLLWPCFDESVSFILPAWPERLLARWINLSTFPAGTNSLFLCSATALCSLLLARRYSITILPRECGTTIKFYWPFSLAQQTQAERRLLSQATVSFSTENNCAHAAQPGAIIRGNSTAP